MHKKAPLPFIGQKRNFINHFINVLNDNIPADGSSWTIVDAFGGSGLLSHVSKSIRAKARVIYNDFDDYHKRLEAVNDTNTLRNRVMQAVGDSPRQKKLSGSAKARVIRCVQEFDGFVDLRALASWVLFSGEYINSIEELNKHMLYNTVRRNDYDTADDYLKGIEVVKKDFELLLEEHKDNPKCLFVLDPPYICTKQGMYANDSYFGMVKFLRLMRHVRPPFIFFSSTRSELLDYLDFVIRHKVDSYEKIEGYELLSINSIVNGTTRYEDNLVYKFNG